MFPYAASVGWYASWLHALSVGKSGDEGAAFANREVNVKGKGFTRCKIKGGAGEIFLSIPVEGGAARLKREASLPGLLLSEHGNWRHVHQGALNAAYGRSPYFQHLMPSLAKVYASEEKSLAGFNALIHEAIIAFLLPENALPSRLSAAPYHEAAIARGKELADMIPPGISIIDPLMRFGRETLLSLLALNPQFLT